MADVSKIKLPDNSVLDIRDTSKITDPSTKSSGQYLTYNGTSWVADDIPQTAVDTLSIDSAPTNGSSNLVTSGGVYTAIQNSSGSTVFLTGTLSGESYPLSHISISEKYSDLQGYLHSLLLTISYYLCFSFN